MSVNANKLVDPFANQTSAKAPEPKSLSTYDKKAVSQGKHIHQPVAVTVDNLTGTTPVEVKGTITLENGTKILFKETVAARVKRDVTVMDTPGKILKQNGFSAQNAKLEWTISRDGIEIEQGEASPRIELPKNQKKKVDYYERSLRFISLTNQGTSWPPPNIACREGQVSYGKKQKLATDQCDRLNEDLAWARGQLKEAESANNQWGSAYSKVITNPKGYDDQTKRAVINDAEKASKKVEAAKKEVERAERALEDHNRRARL